MKKLYPILFALVLFFGGMAAGAIAQDAAPQADAPQAPDAVAFNPLIGTAISYQGQLRNASGPINGVCDMTFQLFNGVIAGRAIAGPIARQVAVTNGLFVTALDFGAAAFNGEARALEVGVKCEGDATFTMLTPRQAIAPDPYALALPGLRTEQNGISPNVIGGSVSNTVGTSVRGAVIGGGGDETAPNVVTGNYSVIGSGEDNQAGASYTVVGGGYGNTTSGRASTVSGGGNNTANGSHAVVGGGFDNIATGDFATIPGGSGALASHQGQMAYATGKFAVAGDAQTSVYVMQGEAPADRNGTELLLGSGIFKSRLTISNTQTLAFDILIVARSTTGESSAWRYEGVIENNGGVTAFIGTPIKTTLGEDDAVWDVIVVANDGGDALQITGLSNQSGDAVRFVATVRTVEVAW